MIARWIGFHIVMSSGQLAKGDGHAARLEGEPRLRKGTSRDGYANPIYRLSTSLIRPEPSGSTPSDLIPAAVAACAG